VRRGRDGVVDTDEARPERGHPAARQDPGDERPAGTEQRAPPQHQQRGEERVEVDRGADPGAEHAALDAEAGEQRRGERDHEQDRAETVSLFDAPDTRGALVLLVLVVLALLIGCHGVGTVGTRLVAVLGQVRIDPTTLLGAFASAAGVELRRSRRATVLPRTRRGFRTRRGCGARAARPAEGTRPHRRPTAHAPGHGAPDPTVVASPRRLRREQ